MEDLEVTESEQWKIQQIQRRISVLVTVLLILAVLLCLYVAIQVICNGYVNFGGYMMFRVVTGSMEPAIPTGALLITKEADIQTIELQDIVCFIRRKAPSGGKL